MSRHRAPRRPEPATVANALACALLAALIALGYSQAGQVDPQCHDAGQARVWSC